MVVEYADVNFGDFVWMRMISSGKNCVKINMENFYSTVLTISNNSLTNVLIMTETLVLLV